MKSVLVAVFLFVALANCLSPFSEYISTLKNEKRGSNNVGECFPATCGGVGDHCLGPNDIPSCGAACALALGTCAEQNQGIQTCDCLAAAVACLNATQSSECIFASYALFARCASSGNCQVNECGVPPSQVPPVPTCINSFCEDQTCMALGDTGAACIDDSQCMGVCNNGTCLTYPMMGPGDGCTANEQCYTMNCTNNVCVGVAAGGNCMYSSQCDAGFYCGGSSTCVPLVASGGACESSDQCGMWGFCKAGVCAPLYSTAAGAACTGPEECTFGYVCGPAGTCIAYEAIVPEGPCSTQTDCTTAYGVSASCNCNPMIGANLCAYGDFLLPQCAAPFNAMVTCLVTSGCGTFNPLPGSCTTVHCGNEFNCAVSCLFEVDDVLRPSVEAGCVPFHVGTCVSTTGEQTTTGEAQTTTGEAQTTTGEAQTTTGEAQTTTGEAQTTTGEAQTTTGAAQTTTGAAQGTTGQVTTTGAGADDSSASSVVLSFFTLCLILIALF